MSLPWSLTSSAAQGVYTDRGEHTCVGRPGSQGYEKLDAKTYAEWGVDCERRPALFPLLQRDTLT